MGRIWASAPVLCGRISSCPLRGPGIGIATPGGAAQWPRRDEESRPCGLFARVRTSVAYLCCRSDGKTGRLGETVLAVHLMVSSVASVFLPSVLVSKEADVWCANSALHSGRDLSRSNDEQGFVVQGPQLGYGGCRDHSCCIACFHAAISLRQ